MHQSIGGLTHGGHGQSRFIKYGKSRASLSNLIYSLSPTLWLDANDSSTITLANGAVSEWRDKSGNNLHATQTTANNRPLLVNYGLNSTTVVKFSANKFMSANFSMQGLTACSIFCVGVRGTTDFDPWLGNYNPSPARGIILGNRISANATLLDGRPHGGSYISSSLSPNLTGGNLLYGEVTNSYMRVGANGLLGSSTTYSIPTIQANPTLYLGTYAPSDLSYDSSLAQIIIFSRVLNQAERELIEGYLAWVTGLTANLPSTHPYRSIHPLETGLQYNQKIPSIYINKRPVYARVTPTPSLFIDGSSLTTDKVGNVLIATGLVSISTFIKKYGSAIARDTSSDSTDIITVVIGGNIFTFGTGDFTIEFWLNHNVQNTQSYDAMLLDTRNESTNNNTEVYVEIDRATGQVRFGIINQPTTLVVSTSVKRNTWHWIQIIRSAGVIKLYVDGVEEASATSSFNIISYRAIFFRNAFASSLSIEPFRGYIEDFRVFKGYANIPFVPTTSLYWDGSYQRPKARKTTVYRNVSSDIMLYLRVNNGVITDISSSPVALTLNGTTVSYSIERIAQKGSIYTNGTGGLITAIDTKFQLGSQDFTVEFWQYSPSGATNADHLSSRSSANTNGFTYYGGNSYYSTNGSGWTNTIVGSYSANVWNHITTTRQGSTLYYFINGVLQGTSNVGSNSIVTQSQIAVGSTTANVQRVVAYYDDIRIIKGRALYTATFNVNQIAEYP